MVCPASGFFVGVFPRKIHKRIFFLPHAHYLLLMLNTVNNEKELSPDSHRLRGLRVQK